MGVINITPNSFSDRTSLLHQDEILKNTCKQFLQIPGLIFDFGFESTAPMNEAITALEERRRFDHFFKTIEGIDFSSQWISFDTYRPSNYRYFEEQFSSRYKGCGFIFNDVSGVIDPELIELLAGKAHQDNFYYLYASTHIPSRDKVLKHMDFLVNAQSENAADIIEMTFNHFVQGFEQLKKIGMAEKIIFDPCFGFSKTYEQNWQLLNHLDDLILKTKKAQMERPWLIGLSKKSFLRKSLVNSRDPFVDAEILHEKILNEIFSKKMGQLICRAHDPFLVERCYAGL